MTEFSFDADRLSGRLKRLSQRHVLTFGVWQLERMIPNFIQFCIESGSEGVWFLNYVASHAWSVIETGDKGLLPSPKIELIDKISPETEGNLSLYVSSALDTVSAAENLIKYIKYENVDFIVEMSSIARDSADIFIQISNYGQIDDNDINGYILKHPLMQIELQYQEADIMFLEHLRERDDQFFSAVIARCLAEPYGRKWL